jgi:hypothetical protein
LYRMAAAVASAIFSDKPNDRRSGTDATFSRSREGHGSESGLGQDEKTE